MSQQSRQTVTMRDFPGLLSEIDPLDLSSGGARIQTNLQCAPGSMEVRGGIKNLQFEDDGEVTPP